MVKGFFDSSTWEIVSAGYIWTDGACRDADGWMDRTERIEDEGIRGKVQELFREGKLNTANSGDRATQSCKGPCRCSRLLFCVDLYVAVPQKAGRVLMKRERRRADLSAR